MKELKNKIGIKTLHNKPAAACDLKIMNDSFVSSFIVRERGKLSNIKSTTVYIYDWSNWSSLQSQGIEPLRWSLYTVSVI